MKKTDDLIVFHAEGSETKSGGYAYVEGNHADVVATLVRSMYGSDEIAHLVIHAASAFVTAKKLGIENPTKNLLELEGEKAEDAYITEKLKQKGGKTN